MLSIDDLPKFGPMGAEPPLTSKPMIIGQAFFGAGLDSPPPQAAEAIRLLVSGQAEVYSRFPEAVAWTRERSNLLKLYRAQQDWDSLNMVSGAALGAGAIVATVATGGIAGVAAAAALGTAAGASGVAALRKLIISKGGVEFRRVVYSQRWIREGPVMQISPGNTQTFSSQRTIGISSTKSKELSLALGFKHTGRTELGTQISKRIETTVTIHKEQMDTATQEFRNDRSGYYRRVACWYVQHEFAVDALIASSVSASSPAAWAQSLQWAPRESTSFISPYAGHSTYADVPGVLKGGGGGRWIPRSWSTRWPPRTPSPS